MSEVLTQDAGLTICITGSSASGKTTLAKILCQELDIIKVPGHTTRCMRSGEQEGWDFHYVSQKAFDDNWHNHCYIDTDYKSTQYNGASYGSPAGWLSRGGKLITPTSTETTKYIQEWLRSAGRAVLWVHLYADEQERLARLESRGVPPSERDYRLSAGDSQGVKREAALNIDTGSCDIHGAADAVLEEISISLIQRIGNE